MGGGVYLINSVYFSLKFISKEISRAEPEYMNRTCTTPINALAPPLVRRPGKLCFLSMFGHISQCRQTR